MHHVAQVISLFGWPKLVKFFFMTVVIKGCISCTTCKHTFHVNILLWASQCQIQASSVAVRTWLGSDHNMHACFAYVNRSLAQI